MRYPATVQTAPAAEPRAGEWWCVELDDGTPMLTFWRGHAPVSCWWQGWLIPIATRHRISDSECPNCARDKGTSLRREVVPDHSAIEANPNAACRVPLHRIRDRHK
ncbi:hypothetical protein RCO28_20695 [Streptomyces sp. LHD-70]|uniref:hypothetical protein n=1 Tax=Streptomyces sp. LHD-70 TaxID=3072140 RepID=UPI00280E7096|nr:hypothetical protein [Streptomyces sp. LHD-70]MDQ8704892.1 hypothetical protein [Streptomyces sp. LHD-70]